MVNDILDLAQINAGKLTIHERPYSLANLIQDMNHLFSPQAESKGLTFKVITEIKLENKLVGDEQRIRQILINLIGNAIKFTEQGGVTLTIWSMRKNLFFKVEDSGIGVSPEELDNLFQRFEQADGAISRQYTGGGMGLYISEGLAALMGGMIDASSHLGKGSLFQLQLPYRLSEQLLKPTARNDEADYSGLYSGKVLVADDTELIQMVIRTILESYGAEVTIAENGLRAVELSRSQPFDLIFMDMQMPVMDGIEATTTIRADQNAVPIVALTANVMEKHREQFFSAGCDAFLEKPINRDELKRELGQFLKKDSRKPIATAEEDKPRKPDQPHNGASKKAVVDVSEDMQQIFLRKVLTRNRKSLIDALNRDDTEEVFRVAHTLKGSGSTFGFPSVSRLAAMVCDVIENHNGEQTTRYVSELTDEIDHIQGSSKNVGLLVR